MEGEVWRDADGGVWKDAGGRGVEGCRCGSGKVEDVGVGSESVEG